MSSKKIKIIRRIRFVKTFNTENLKYRFDATKVSKVTEKCLKNKF